jgi:hypothetical protein
MINNWAVKLGILFFMSFIIFGCASLPLPDEMKAEVATYQLPKLPEDGKAIVYVLFTESWYKGIKFDVYIDNQEPKSEIGYNMGGQYIYFDLSPGEHKILSKAENWAEINVSAKAGDIIFIRQEPYTGLLNARNKLLTLQDYEGKYHVKTLTIGTIINQSQPNVPTVQTQAQMGQIAKADTFIGTITGGNMAKGIGFSNLNVKINVTSESGEQAFFYVRSDSKVFNASGNPINYLEASRGKGKKVQIHHFIIKDGTGGKPGRSDFAYEIGHKGVLSLRFLN